MEMSRYILRALLARPYVTFSWGFNNIRPLENGLQFTTRGYIHSGDVTVTYDEASDSFTICTLLNDGTVKERKENVYIQELSDTIDRMVEYCENYKERIIADYF